VLDGAVTEQSLAQHLRVGFMEGARYQAVTLVNAPLHA